MNRVAMKWLFTSGVGLLFLCITLVTCQATEVVSVRNREGVWLVSDSLSDHNDGVQITYAHKCKVVISRGRLIYNVGFFKDASLLFSQESLLPFADMKTTEKSINILLKTNHMDMRGNLWNSPDLLVVTTGILQVENSVFQEEILGQTDDMRTEIRFVKAWKMGIPHGFGTAVSRVNRVAGQDPTVAARIANNPKAELLKIISEEAANRPQEVSGPYTVLLLRNDGSVSDFSDNSLCRIPADAAHVRTPTRSHHQR